MSDDKMNDINEKYLLRVLDNAKEGLVQINEGFAALEQQKTMMTEQKEEVEEAIAELTQILGLEEETEDE
jgi:hypothetical protein